MLDTMNSMHDFIENTAHMGDFNDTELALLDAGIWKTNNGTMSDDFYIERQLRAVLAHLAAMLTARLLLYRALLLRAARMAATASSGWSAQMPLNRTWSSVLSLFIAVILDNLELGEDVKKLKQRKMREISAETQQKLPLRLRVFEKFPNRPQMISLGRLIGDFLLPRIRDSFMRQLPTTLPQLSTWTRPTIGRSAGGRPAAKLHNLLNNEGKLMAVNFLLETAASGWSRAALTGWSWATFAHRSLLGVQHQIRQHDRRSRGRPLLSELASKPGHAGKPSVSVDSASLGQATAGQNGAQWNRGHFQLTSARRNAGQKALQAERLRTQQEAELRENHPFFDKPLFAVGAGESPEGSVQAAVWTPATTRAAATRTELKIACWDKGALRLLGLVTYLDWVMIAVTVLSITCMTFETLNERVMNTAWLRAAEYIFFVAMTTELTLKVVANDFSSRRWRLCATSTVWLDLFIYATSLLYMCYMLARENCASGSIEQWPDGVPLPPAAAHLQPGAAAYAELYTSWSAASAKSSWCPCCCSYSSSSSPSTEFHLFGGRLGICNDRSKTTKEECVGTFEREVFVTRLRLEASRRGSWCPGCGPTARNFNFDTIGGALLAPVLSLEGWVDVRDILMSRVHPSHADYIHLFVFIGCLIGLTLFVGVVVANYSENKGTALLTVDQRRWLDLKGRIKLTQPLRIPPRPNVAARRQMGPGQGSGLRCGAERQWLDDLMVDKQTNYTKYSAVPVLAMCAVTCTLLFVGRGLHEMHRADLLWLLAVLAQPLRRLGDRGRRPLAGAARHLAGPSGRSAALLREDFGWFVVVFRLFTLAGKHPTLKMLMLTVLMSTFKSFFIILGMFLLLLVYALSGVILFGNVKHGGGLNRQANFSHCWRATLLLLRIVTGEDWNKNHARLHGTSPCSYTNDEDALLSHTDIRQFQNTWNLLDDSRRGSISLRKCKILLRMLTGRLQIIDSGKLAYRSVDIRKSLQLPELLARQELEFTIEEEVAKADHQGLAGQLREAESAPTRPPSAAFSATCAPPTRQPTCCRRPRRRSRSLHRWTSLAVQPPPPPRRRKALSRKPSGGGYFESDDLGGGSGRPASLTMGAKRRRPARAANPPGGDSVGDGGEVAYEDPGGPDASDDADYDEENRDVIGGIERRHPLRRPAAAARRKRRSVTHFAHSSCQEVKDWWKSNMLLGPADGLVAKDLEDAFDEEEFDEDDGRF
uniref:Ion_trans domain-containing protein n=1 Tax=Macrostomum lignano TaxID=282301 RepID=A0A1I8F992_9PLAT